YAGAKPGGTAAMNEPWFSGDGRSTGDESFFGSGRPKSSGDRSDNGLRLLSSDDYSWYEYIPLVPLVTRRNDEGHTWWDAVPGAPAFNLVTNWWQGRQGADQGQVLDQRRLEYMERMGRIPPIDQRSRP